MASETQAKPDWNSPEYHENNAPAKPDWNSAEYHENTSSTEVTKAQLDGEEIEVEVAIIGGGLGGLAVAVGLQQRGIDAHVFEAAPELRNVSQGVIGLFENGRKALGALHPPVLEEIKKSGKFGKDVRGFDRDEDFSTRIRLMPGESVVCRWHRIQEVLHSHVKPDYVHTGCKVAWVKEDSEFAYAGFDKPAVDDPVLKAKMSKITRVKAKLLVGSDGAFSVIRKFIPKTLSPDEPEFFGQLNWAGLLHKSVLPYDPFEKFYHVDGHTGPTEPYTGTVVVLKCKAPITWYLLIDCGDDFLFWQLRITDEEKKIAASGPSGRGGLGLAGCKKNILEAMKAHNDVTSIIEATPEECIFERSIYHRLPIDRYSTDGRRIVIIGDAAHGMHSVLGQGANTTFEDAVVLTEAIKRYRSDLPHAVKVFEELRIPRANRIQGWAARLGARQKHAKHFEEDPQAKEEIRKEIGDLRRWLNSFDPYCVEKYVDLPEKSSVSEVSSAVASLSVS
eukprot:CAMPEP_0196653076 /NCGR_PEP_ID=MMETSP1086-20130531/2656_1 /TAXON_ID=77921 /ORGANISM="Cyanoptyche  gloeocystis , Strain SAG4.97" /LENGTH=503 /DNA_ID=CAMNT_0041984073 /DNA_START=77 /DNA_END=1588 /DNA_ORIENTATION=-